MVAAVGCAAHGRQGPRGRVMGWRRTSRDVPPPAPPPPERPPVFMATTDTLPPDYEVLGLVHASQQMAGDYFPTNSVLDSLSEQAASMGADGVIGITMSQVFI